MDTASRTIHAELTAHLIEKADAPETGQRFIRDTKTSGLALRITERGVKSYIVEAWTGKRSRRKTLGKADKLELAEARKLAKVAIGAFASGRDTVAEEQAERVKGKTLKEAFNDFLKSRKQLKPRTVTDYKYVMKEAFSDWQDKALTSITADMVERRHTQLGEASHARANNAMRVLRAIFNYAAAKYDGADGQPLITYNPVKRLSATKAWYEVGRRRTVIKKTDLKPWYKAVTSLHSDHSAHRADVIRDYLLLLLFTGLRRGEAAGLRFSDIDFKEKTLTVTDTKNHRPHTLPLSDYLLTLLETRHKEAAGELVFPGRNKDGYIQEARKQMAKVTEQSGVSFTLHDLRRTFITIAESIDIPGYALKQLLNHKDKNDVTAGYIVMDVERLRGPMQKITDYILKEAGVKKTATVTPINKARRKKSTPGK